MPTKANAQADKIQSAKAFKRQITTTVSAEYLLYLPHDYDQKKSKRWPLILFLHGAGERGTNVWTVAVHGPPKIVKAKPDFQFIVVSPQCPTGQTWNNDTIMALLDEITAKYKVDKSRVYLTGLSMGGFGSWSLATSHPERFAAVAPICGGGDPIRILLADKQRLEILKSLPIWAFHGAKDNVVKLERSEQMVNAFKKIGNDVKLTVYPEAGHDSWTEAYNNPELYEWFLQHSRPQK
ncbi:MAG: prolyl oligopeptidase family serine peptidase [Verrucomicrobia bacterium]|nr:prolyl oligopeptidase family serine peptidase [Verrucomicrobiota bacterium]